MNFSYLNNQVFPGHNVPLKPKVSVCLITYAHENYLDTCLQNILNQEVDFAYEIIIGEDCSPDKTAEIVKRYAEQFPEKIKAFIRPQNVGAKINFLDTTWIPVPLGASSFSTVTNNIGAGDVEVINITNQGSGY